MKFKKAISYISLLVIFSIFAYFFVTNISEFKKISLASPNLVILLICLITLNLLVIGLLNSKFLLAHLGVEIGVMEAFGLAVISRVGNYLTPFRGGMVTRAIYLKKKHDFSYTNFVTILSASYILIFLVASFLGMLSLFLIYLDKGIFNKLIFSAFLAVFAFLLSVVLFSPKLRETKNKFINRFINVINGWESIRKNKKLVFTISLLALIYLIINSGLFLIQFRMLGVEIPFIGALLIAVMSVLVFVIGITPANLGISEALVVLSASVIGISFAESVSAALLGRAVSILTLIVLGPIFSYYLLKKKGTKDS